MKETSKIELVWKTLFHAKDVIETLYTDGALNFENEMMREAFYRINDICCGLHYYMEEG